MVPEAVVWHCAGTGSHLKASMAASLWPAQLVGARNPCRTLQWAGGISLVNSSEAWSCCITLKEVKGIIRLWLEWYSFQCSSGSGLPSDLLKCFSGYEPPWLLSVASVVVGCVTVWEREAKLALTWSAKCSLTPSCRRHPPGMLDLQSAEIQAWRGRVLFGFEQQTCKCLLRHLPGDCSCWGSLQNTQKYACCTTVVRKY